MITNWENHWDNLRDDSTYYTTRMFKRGMNESKLIEDTKTVFIKRNKETKELEKAWRGEVFGFRKSTQGGKDRISFKVMIQDEIPGPPEYSDYSEGWYVDEKEELPEESLFDPGFFSDLRSTNEWLKFEKYTYYLIRCLGIHTSFRFAPKKQRGKADGFFKFRNFAVLYDCTLERNFEKSKETQIENFCDQMKKEIIEYNRKRIDIRNCNKSVWIITKDGNQRLIKQIDEIHIKEVPVEKIITLYRKRINEDIDETIFEKDLRSL